MTTMAWSLAICMERETLKTHKGRQSRYISAIQCALVSVMMLIMMEVSQQRLYQKQYQQLS